MHFCEGCGELTTTTSFAGLQLCPVCRRMAVRLELEEDDHEESSLYRQRRTQSETDGV